MARKLPPLNALRAFEASARHLSFSRAADELCVTPAAISQHVKQLESYFGQDLFERRPRGGLELTEAGRACIPGIRPAFELLVNSCARIASLADPDRVTLLVSPSLTAKWLGPRLHRFHSAYPRIDVQIWANVTGRFHDPHDHDLAIYYSPSTRGLLEPLTIQSCARDPFGAGDWVYWKPGQIGRLGNRMRESHGRIHFCGEHTAIMQRGMEAAFESGERAALEILQTL